MAKKYGDTGSRRAKALRNETGFKSITKWTSKAEAKRWGNKFALTQGHHSIFQIKQKGSKWAVFAKKK